MFGNSKEENFKKELGCEYLLVDRPAFMAFFPDRIETGGCGFVGKMEVSSLERQRIDYENVAQITLLWTFMFKILQIEYKGKDKVEKFPLNKKNKKIAEEAIEFVNQILDSIKTNKENFKSSPVEEKTDIPEQIKKLSDLKDQGILTEEEFQSKKKDLLDKM
tara:strand:- start:53 stop:538 length:486 start_codon:yes stop_codon:yes gene_type:complete